MANITHNLRSRTIVQVTGAAASKVTKPKRNLRKRRPREDPWTPKRKPKTAPKPRVPPPTHATCRICLEEQSMDRFPSWLSRSRRLQLAHAGLQGDVPRECIEHLCRNPYRKKIDPVCKVCIGRSMSARLDIVGAQEVGNGCLEPTCRYEWSWAFIVKYMPGGAPLEKFNMEMYEVYKRDPTNRMIECIAPGCEAIGLPDQTAPGYPQVACHTCDFRFCARCLVPWHSDLTCAEHGVKHVDEQMTDTEKETLKLMQTKDGKRCPNCYLVIEKDGGCDSMFCTGCHKYFNWATAGKTLTP